MSAEGFRDQTAIVGIGYSRSAESPGGFSKNSGESVLTLAVRAAREACADAGVAPVDVEGAVMYSLSNDSVGPGQVLSALGSRNIKYGVTIDGGGNNPSLIATLAGQAVHGGAARYVLAYRAMNGRSGIRTGQLGGNTARGNLAPGPAQWSSIYGMAGPPLGFAMAARRYMETYNVSSEDFGHWAVNARFNAMKNPRATMREAITVEDHQNSRYIVEPYHLLDCCLETDVAVAVLVASTEEASSLRKTPVTITAGFGGGSPPLSDIVETGFRYTGQQLLDAAGISLGDIDSYHPYENFTDNPMRQMEDMGWMEHGEAAAFAREGRIGLDGEIPISTQGGLMNEGYGHGFNNVLEAVQQLRGEAEDLCPNWEQGEHTYDRELCRQVRDPEVSMHASVSGSGGLILKKG